MLLLFLWFLLSFFSVSHNFHLVSELFEWFCMVVNMFIVFPLLCFCFARDTDLWMRKPMPRDVSLWPEPANIWCLCLVVQSSRGCVRQVSLIATTCHDDC